MQFPCVKGKRELRVCLFVSLSVLGSLNEIQAVSIYFSKHYIEFNLIPSVGLVRSVVGGFDTKEALLFFCVSY